MKLRELIFSMFGKLVKPLWGSELSKFRPIQRGYDFLYMRLRPRDIVSFDIEGNRFYTDPADIPPGLFSFLHGTSHKAVARVFKREIKPGMNVLNLGANMGYFTLLASRLVGEQGRVFAFEPAPDNFALLTKNITLNRCNNVIPVQKAVSDKSGQAKLFLRESGTHSIYDFRDGREEFITVETVALDEFFEEKDLPIGFIKMDIEGAETAALNGMANLIKKNRNLKIITEVHADFLKKAGSSLEEFTNKLMEYGFKLYDVNEKGGTIEFRGVASFLKTHSEGGKFRKFTVLFCVKEA